MWGEAVEEKMSRDQEALQCSFFVQPLCMSVCEAWLCRLAEGCVEPVRGLGVCIRYSRGTEHTHATSLE